MQNQTEYDAFVSKVHGMVTFEMMRELDKRNAVMIFQNAQVPGPSFEDVRDQREVELAITSPAGRHFRVTFDKFMESTMLVPDNKPNPNNGVLVEYVRPLAAALADAVEKHVRELKPLPFFATDPPVVDQEHMVATKVTKIFGELPVRSELCSREDGKFVFTTSILYGSAV